jgi:NADH-quinone oxidoreductase subunit M
MQETDLILMSLVIFVPALFALGIVLFPRGKDEAVRWWSLAGTALTLGLSLCAFISFRKDTLDQPGLESRKQAPLDTRVRKLDELERTKGAGGGTQKTDQRGTDWVSRHPWIEPFQIHYFVGADGISMALVLLTTVISFVAMIASWKIEKFVKGYCMLFLLLETGMIGVFLALDFFLFFIFWEVMLLPMYFLIGIWGGPNREYAAMKFFLYTLFGGVLMLVAMLAFYFTDVRDFKKNDPRDFTTDSTGKIVSANFKRNLEGLPAEERKQIDSAWTLDGTPDRPVHTFDLVLLARVGMEASRIIDGKPGNALDQAKRAYEAEKDPELKKQYKEKVDRLSQGFFTKPFQITMFVLLFIGFAIKLPMVPFHTWLPDAHVEAPTPISMILAGVLLKMGGYGIIRIAFPICPWAAKELATLLAVLGLVSLIYGAFAAMAQTDFKKLVAYSSVSHMGYVLLGLAVWPTDRPDLWAWGMNGAIFQMLAHGVSSAGMFFMVGVIYDRAHHRNLDNFRGLAEPMPLYSGMSAVIFFAGLGLPGLCGFVGEFMVVLATWNFNPWMSVIAAIAVVFTAGYILWCIQRVYLGTNAAYKNYDDMSPREIACATPLVVLAVLLGILPTLMVFNWMEPSVKGLVDSLYTLTSTVK